MKTNYSEYFAVSLKGNDKGTVYAIIREEKEYVFLADGKHRRLESPKKKKKKHIECLIANKISEYISEGTLITNGRLRRAIRNFKMDNEEVFNKKPIEHAIAERRNNSG